VFYDSKLYFYLLVELICFVFIIIETEHLKDRNMEIYRSQQQQNFDFIKKQLDTDKELRDKFLSLIKEK